MIFAHKAEMTPQEHPQTGDSKVPLHLVQSKDKEIDLGFDNALKNLRSKQLQYTDILNKNPNNTAAQKSLDLINRQITNLENRKNFVSDSDRRVEQIQAQHDSTMADIELNRIQKEHDEDLELHRIQTDLENLALDKIQAEHDETVRIDDLKKRLGVNRGNSGLSLRAEKVVQDKKLEDDINSKILIVNQLFDTDSNTDTPCKVNIINKIKLGKTLEDAFSDELENLDQKITALKGSGVKKLWNKFFGNRKEINELETQRKIVAENAQLAIAQSNITPTRRHHSPTPSARGSMVG